MDVNGKRRKTEKTKMRIGTKITTERSSRYDSTLAETGICQPQQPTAAPLNKRDSLLPLMPPTSQQTYTWRRKQINKEPFDQRFGPESRNSRFAASRDERAIRGWLELTYVDGTVTAVWVLTFCGFAEDGLWSVGDRVTEETCSSNCFEATAWSVWALWQLSYHEMSVLW